MPIASQPASADSRNAIRKGVRLRAKMRDRGSSAAFPVDVVDLSTTGYRCETSFTLYPGHTVWLTLPGLQALEGKVAWRNGYLHGVAFDRPLYPAVFDHVVKLASN